jgi:hypothetical protein
MAQETKYDPMAGLTRQADGSVTDDRSGVTLEVCERCNEFYDPSGIDDIVYTGLCDDCKAKDSRNFQDKMAMATAALDRLTPEQRVEVFGEYCVHCGDRAPQGCHCTNDD